MAYSSLPRFREITYSRSGLETIHSASAVFQCVDTQNSPSMLKRTVTKESRGRYSDRASLRQKLIKQGKQVPRKMYNSTGHRVISNYVTRLEVTMYSWRDVKFQELNTHAPYVCGFARNNMVHGCMVYTERAETAAVSRGTSHISAVSTPLCWIFKNAL